MKAFPAEDLRRSDRAAFLVSNSDDGPGPVGLKLIEPAIQLGQGDKNCLLNVAVLPDELVRIPYIEYERCLALREQCL
jgi:hypothetical protein